MHAPLHVVDRVVVVSPLQGVVVKVDVAPRFEGLTDLDDRSVPQSGDVSDVKPSHFVNMPHVENSDPIVVWGVPAILPLENGFLGI